MAITINGTTGIAGVDGSAGTPAVQGTDTNTGVFFGTDTVTIATGGTAAVTVDSGQRTKFPTTIGVGGATPSTSGSGISFPASASASSDANTLDDYEEGTWTPTLFGSSSAGTTTYSAQVGGYTKVGRQVTISCYIQISAMTGTGSLRLGGLPFTVSSTYRSASAPMVNGLNWDGGSMILLYGDGNDTALGIWYSGDDIAWSDQQCVNESIGFIFTHTYFV